MSTLWHKCSGQQKAGIIGVAVIAVVVLIGMASPSDNSKSSGPAAQKTQRPTYSKRAARVFRVHPTRCLKEAGLGEVEKISSWEWRGLANDGTGVWVDEMESVARAKLAVRQADLVWRDSTGRYFVHGPASGDGAKKVGKVTACLATGA